MQRENRLRKEWTDEFAEPRKPKNECPEKKEIEKMRGERSKREIEKHEKFFSAKLFEAPKIAVLKNSRELNGSNPFVFFDFGLRRRYSEYAAGGALHGTGKPVVYVLRTGPHAAISQHQ